MAKQLCIGMWPRKDFLYLQHLYVSRAAGIMTDYNNVVAHTSTVRLATGWRLTVVTLPEQLHQNTQITRVETRNKLFCTH